MKNELNTIERCRSVSYYELSSVAHINIVTIHASNIDQTTHHDSFIFSQWYSGLGKNRNNTNFNRVMSFKRVLLILKKINFVFISFVIFVIFSFFFLGKFYERICFHKSNFDDICWEKKYDVQPWLRATLITTISVRI